MVTNNTNKYSFVNRLILKGLWLADLPIWFPGNRVYLPNGLNTIINRGSSDNAAISAISIASPVRSPNRIVGIKFEITRIENPTIIVSDV